MRVRQAVRVGERQQRQDLTLVVEPLAGGAIMRPFGFEPGRDRMLGIACDFVAHAERFPGGAQAAFADHRERCGHGRCRDLDAGLKAHCVAQLLLERGNIDDPCQRLDLLAGSAELNPAAFVAIDEHFAHGHGMRRVGPRAQRFEEGLRSGVERIGAHIPRGRRGTGCYQSHADALAGQQQRQCASDDAGAANANFGGKSHRGIVGGAFAGVGVRENRGS